MAITTASTPRTIYPDFLDGLRQRSVALSVAHVVLTDGASVIKQPVLETLATAAVVGEGVEATASDPVFSAVTMSSQKVLCRTQVSSEYLADAGEGPVKSASITAVARELDAVAFTALGTGIDAGNVVTAPAAQPTVAELKQAMALVEPSAFYHDPVILMPPSIAAGFADSITVDQGVRYLLGMPLHVSGGITTGTGDRAVFIGSLSTGMTMAVVGEPSSRVVEQTEAESGLVNIMTRLRFAVGVSPVASIAAVQLP